MPRKSAPKKASVIEALQKNLGLITQTAQSLGYGTDRKAVYRLIKRYKLEEVLAEAREISVDVAEAKLVEKINNGDTTALIFFLKTMGKKRGFVERQELTGNEGGPVEVEMVNYAGASKQLPKPKEE